MRIMLPVAVLLLAVCWGPVPAWAAERPYGVIFWASGPNAPGDVVLLSGALLEGATGIRLVRLDDGSADPPAAGDLGMPEGGTQTLPPMQSTADSVKFVLPPNQPPGLFAAQVETPKGPSGVTVINQPEVWWCQGDAGLTATPGQWVRVLGRCLKPAGAAATILLRGPATVKLPAAGDGYSAKASVPPDLPPGEYEVLYHGGFGGRFGWSRPVKLTVAPPSPWPDTVFNVRDFGAKGNGRVSDTAAVTAALKKAADSGGGVVYFPRGSYQLDAMLEIPPGVVLRGAGEDLSQVFWTNPSDKRLPAVIRGSNQFGIEDLSLIFVGADNGIVADLPRRAISVPIPAQRMSDRAGDVHLRRVRARWLLYGDHVDLAQLSQVFQDRFVNRGYGCKGTLFSCGGRNLEITDCDLYSSAGGFEVIGARGALIARNRVGIGRGGWTNFDGADNMICEQNTFVGTDNMVRQGVTFWSKALLRNVYFAHNSISDVFYSDREGLTTDGQSGKYFGGLQSATPNTVTLPAGASFAPDELVGHTCFILGGHGKGQWRTVVTNTGSTLTVDRPWDLTPAESSALGVNHTVARLLIVGNEMRDVGIGFQAYGLLMESIIAENRCLRAGGLFSRAARYPGDSLNPRDTQPQFDIQYLDNEIVEGNTPVFIRRGYDYGEGNSVLGVHAFPGPGEAGTTWDRPLAIGFVFRGNRLDSNAVLRVYPETQAPGLPLIEDVVIERNTIAQAVKGIEVGARCAGVVVRRNTLQNVDEPYAGVGLLEGAWVEK